MKQYTILVADGSEDFREAIRTQFEPFCCVYGCAEGIEALALLQDLRPDVLIVDLMLPRLDGLALLQCVRATGQRPGILVFSRYVSPYLLDRAEKLGAAYLLQKPCRLQRVGDCVRLLLQNRTEGYSRDQYSRLSGMLLDLGFSAKLRGYIYLRDAVLKQTRLPETGMIKDLYKAVGQSFGVAADDVERSIRSAAEDAWDHRVRGCWELYFPGEITNRPSNYRLIQGLTEALERLGEEAAARMV